MKRAIGTIKEALADAAEDLSKDKRNWTSIVVVAVSEEGQCYELILHDGIGALALIGALTATQQHIIQESEHDAEEEDAPHH